MRCAIAKRGSSPVRLAPAKQAQPRVLDRRPAETATVASCLFPNMSVGCSEPGARQSGLEGSAVPEPFDVDAALAHLHASDEVMSKLIRAVGPFEMRSAGPDAFQALARSIMFQQISGAAGTAIYTRFIRLFELAHEDQGWDGGSEGFPTPAALRSLGDDALRGAGLSRQKIAALRSLATHFATGELGDAPFAELDDAAVIERLTRVRGIGRWTAEMFLMFHLRRPDVLPVNDVGINRAIARLYELPGPALPADVQRVGAPWHPYATVACWYLWRSEDVRTPEM
jgi:3-methyladenine DNA glycosylase/8-oxoguanine DNA glycosylase